MITFQHLNVYNLENAIRGARHPLESYNRSDSRFDDSGRFILGINDLDLAKRLRKAGTDHRKFLRQIMVSVDITAPRYWWTEFDTYKVGTTANSTSTMHTIHKKEFSYDMFSMEYATVDYLNFMIPYLNRVRSEYLLHKNKDTWYQLIQILPQSFNQTRTVTLNYEVLLNMYTSRKHHKLKEWKHFCELIETLPYFKEICLND